MAAVTTTGPFERHITGDLASRFYQVSGATGSTLATGLVNIKFVAVQQSTAAGTVSLITSFAVSGGTITFASSGPMVTEQLWVIGREG